MRLASENRTQIACDVLRCIVTSGHFSHLASTYETIVNRSHQTSGRLFKHDVNKLKDIEKEYRGVTEIEVDLVTKLTKLTNLVTEQTEQETDDVSFLKASQHVIDAVGRGLDFVEALSFRPPDDNVQGNGCGYCQKTNNTLVRCELCKDQDIHPDCSRQAINYVNQKYCINLVNSNNKTDQPNLCWKCICEKIDENYCCNIRSIRNRCLLHDGKLNSPDPDHNFDEESEKNVQCRLCNLSGHEQCLRESDTEEFSCAVCRNETFPDNILEYPNSRGSGSFVANCLLDDSGS